MLVVGAKHEDSRRENEKKPVGCMPLFTFEVEVSFPGGMKWMLLVKEMRFRELLIL